MHIYLNIVPQAQLDWVRLTALIEEVNDQRFPDVSLNLQLPEDQELNSTQRHQAESWSLTVGQPEIIPAERTYLLNLRETDHLLPGAIRQWAQVIQQHPNCLISLATFDSGLSLDLQTQDYLTQHAGNRLQTTLQQLMADSSDAVSPQQLALWGLQNYSIQTNLQSPKYLNQRLRPTGLLLPSMQVTPDLPLVSLRQTLTMLQSATEVIRLHVPTITTQSWAMTTPMAWLSELQTINFDQLALGWAPLSPNINNNSLTRF